MAIDKIQAESINLADTFAFTGTVSGTPTSPSFKNIIINGNMSIAQRGTSTSGVTTTDGYYACDRWYTQTDTGTWTISQSTDVPTGQGFSNSLKLDCTSAGTANSDEISIRYKNEGQFLQHLKYGTSSAESITLSFWIKSNKTGTYTVAIVNDQSSQTRIVSINYTISSADTWEKKTITFPGDTSRTIDNTNGEEFVLYWWFSAASNFRSGGVQNTWTNYDVSYFADTNLAGLGGSTDDEVYLTGVQLEVGTSASDFEFLPYDVNFRRCQRYHFRHNPTKDAHVGVLMGFANGGSDINSCTVPVPVPMRANPSLSTDPASGSIAVRYYTPEQGTGTISSYTTLASQGDCASDGSGYLALTLNGFGGNLDGTSPNGIEFESTCLIMDAEL